MTLEATVVDSRAGLTDVAPAWLRLAARSASTPFQTYQWHSVWWRLVGQLDPALRLHVMVFRDGGVVRALAPLMVRDEDGVRELRFLSDPWADYSDMLVDPAVDRDSAGRWLRDACCAELGKRWDRVWLTELPTWPALRTGVAAAWRSQDTRTASPCFRLALDDGPALAAAFDRSQYRVRERRLRRLGEPVLHCHVDPDAIAARMPDFIAMHVRQWHGRPDAGLTFDRPDMVRFYTGCVASLADAGLLMLAELAVAGRPAAFHLGFVHDATFWAYRTTYDTGLRQFSPGHLLNRSLALELRRSGFGCFDLMRGWTAYKEQYASARSTNLTVAVDAGGSQPAPA